MKRVGHFVVLAVLLTVSLGAVPSAADDDESLVGYTSFKVRIELRCEGRCNEVISEELVKSKIELRLRQANITVLDSLSDDGSTGTIVFVARLAERETTAGSFTYFMDLGVWEWGHFLRGSTYAMSWAKVWGANVYGVGTASGIREQTSKNINDFMDVFLNDYLKQNPK